ncbi:hypothetical protein SCE1572_25225 [Sorangium cellulosum So0157-2]|uniref:Uncharacterized protein n=1 Tax=Sorangium cellulosum So0157-2 TaxID=1254432 RepID=S4XYV9_SORCE|nr:hypothetical protein SCE1572_25225 [Sorangium cellulosum So0157-2]
MAAIVAEAHCPGLREGTYPPPIQKSAGVISPSDESRRSIAAPSLGCVPWLQTVIDASRPPPTTRLGGPITAETTRSA